MTLRRFLFCFFWIFTAQIAFGQDDFQTHKIDKRISFDLPGQFVPMTDELRQRAFISPREALAAFMADRDGATAFTVKANQTRWRLEDLELLLQFQKSNVANTVSEAEFYEEEVRKINGRPFAVLSYLSTVTENEDAGLPGADAGHIQPTQKDPSKPVSQGVNLRNLPPIVTYSHAAFTVYEGSLLIFRFQCPARYKHQWDGKIEPMIESIRVK